MKDKQDSSFKQASKSMVSGESGYSGGGDMNTDAASVSEYSRTSNYTFFQMGSAGSSDGGTPTRPEYVDPVVAEKEEKAVFWSRLVVIGILSIALAAMASAMFIVISHNEKDDFQNQVWLYLLIDTSE